MDGRDLWALSDRERTLLRERAEGLLARLEVAELAERYPATLSGGQQRRVAVARGTLTVARGGPL